MSCDEQWQDVVVSSNQNAMSKPGVVARSKCLKRGQTYPMVRGVDHKRFFVEAQPLEFHQDSPDRKVYFCHSSQIPDTAVSAMMVSAKPPPTSRHRNEELRGGKHQLCRMQRFNIPPPQLCYRYDLHRNHAPGFVATVAPNEL